MLQLIRDFREFREFLAAKKRKREPIRWNARGATEAVYIPSSARGFANFRAACRGVGDWGLASERLDRIEHELIRKHGARLPTPRKVMQNPDRSLSLFWQGAMVRCLTDGVVSVIGGIDGIPRKGVPRELIELLAFQAKIQGS